MVPSSRAIDAEGRSKDGRLAEQQEGTTFQVIVDDYLKKRVVGSDPGKSQNETRQRGCATTAVLRRCLARRPAKLVTADDIEELLEPKAEKQPAIYLPIAIRTALLPLLQSRDDTSVLFGFGQCICF